MTGSLPTAGPESIREGPHPTLVRPGLLFQGDHPCRRQGPRCDDRVRDHSCDHGTARVDRARPPLVRPRSGRLLAGVASGTAAHLRQDPLLVRVIFVVLATFGVGIVVYGLLWLTMPVAAPGTEEPTPGTIRLRARRETSAAHHRRPRVRRGRHRSARWPAQQRRPRPAADPRRGRPGGHLAAARHRPHARPSRRPLGSGRGSRAGRRRRRAAAGDDRPARRRPQRLRRDPGHPHRGRPRDRADLAPAARLPGRGAHRAHPLGGAGGGRRAPARLGAADAGPHPAARRGTAGGGPAGPQPGARAAGVALRPEGRARGRHVGGPGRRHGRRRRVRPRADGGSGRGRGRPGRRRAGRPRRGDPRGAGQRGQALGRLGRRPLHRGDPRARVGLHPRPRQGVRSGDGVRRPARPARFGARPAHATGGRRRSGPRPGRGPRWSSLPRVRRERARAHCAAVWGRGRRAPARMATRSSSSTTTPWSAPGCAPSSASGSRWSARAPTSPARSRASAPPDRTSSCSTCICPAAAAAPCWRRCGPSCRT